MDENPNPSEAPFADAATLAELARLSAAAQAAAPGDTAPWAALWAATLALPRWIFIARGDEQHPSPFMAVMDEGPMLMAFTTPERAREGGLSLGLPEGELGRLLAVPGGAAVDWVASFAQHGVVGIAFDHPTLGYFSPLANLPRIRDWLAAGG